MGFVERKTDLFPKLGKQGKIVKYNKNNQKQKMFRKTLVESVIKSNRPLAAVEDNKIIAVITRHTIIMDRNGFLSIFLKQMKCKNFIIFNQLKCKN